MKDFLPYRKQEQVDISDLLGKTIVEISEVKGYDEKLALKTACGCIYTMYHEEDCCEEVYLADITGNLVDLIGYPILEAKEEVSDTSWDDSGDTATVYTFYKINTANLLGGVCLRWCGTHNGYYFVSISIAKRKINE